MREINVIGLGYIGLPTALMFASSGIKVIGTDINSDIVETLNKGEITFEEEGLDALLKQAMENGIEFTTEYKKTNKYIITVPTPYLKDTKKLDDKYVISAVNSILKVCEKGSIIIIESTISPGTINNSIKQLIEKKGFKIGEDIHLAHAPERIIPGNMINELKNNSRTIGADNIEIGQFIKEVYSTFCNGEIIITDIKTAELSKVVENTYRDINIAFANELSRICRREDIDVYELIDIANKHPRVGILKPGPGVGGHCISVDPWFLVGDYPDIANLIAAAREVNDGQPDFVITRLRDIMKKYKVNDISRVGLYGLTYKENVDDTRESPTIQLLDRLSGEERENIRLFDPLVKNKFVKNQENNFEIFVGKIDILVIMVAHDHLRDNIHLIRDKYIIDTRNHLKDEELEKFYTM